MADTGQGYKYQLGVTAYLASQLSQHQTVKDYYIFYEVQEVEPFDDIVLAVQFNGSEDFNLYLVQVKSGKVSLDIKKYLDGYNKIKQNKNRKFFGKIGKINEENIQFWYFACKILSKSQDISFKEDSETKQFELKERKSDATGSIIDQKYNKNYKLCLKGDNTTTKHQDFFDNFYVYVGQPSAEKIEVVLRGMWKLNDSTQVIDYLDKYLIKYKQNHLSKTVFDLELLRIRLSNYIVSPIKTIPCQREPAVAWINLTLSHNITIIENATHTKPCLFGCILAKIGDIITPDEWNKCIDNDGKLSDEIKTKFSSLKIKPQTMKDLVIYFWMSDEIPLILKADNELSALKEFAHLNKHYVIIDSKLKKRYDEMETYNLSVIKDIAGLQTHELLHSILISIQGKKPASLYKIINADMTLLKTLTCSDILKLIEPKQVYLKDECFKDGSDMVFIIEKEDTEELNQENYITIGDNILMYCPPNQSGLCYEGAVQNPKFKNYKIYRLCAQTSEDSEEKLSLANKLELDEAAKITGSNNLVNEHAGLEYFFVDQHGNNVYRENENRAVSVIGEMINISCPKYLDRRMNKRTIKRGENRSSPDNNRNPVVECTESSFWENDFFIQTTRKICVVTGEPGIGKSTFLRSLIHICQPSNYILFCDLARYQTDLYDKRRKQSELCRDPLNFLCNKHNSLPYSKFLSALKKDARRLIIVLDSLDEVVATCKESVLKLINKLNCEPGLGKIIIGSRLLTANLLSNQFDVDLVEIEGLDKEWNGDYIQNWNIDENYLQNVPVEFVKNPLYLNLLRTIAESNMSMESINKWTLYKTILDLNIDLYYERRNQNPDDTDRKNILKYCYALAFRAFLPYNKITRKLAEYIKGEYTNYGRIGVIRSFNKKGVPVFVHRTFLEFLISRWLIEAADKEDAKHVYEYLLRNRMHDTLHIHSEQFRLHKAVIGKELTQVQNLCNEDSELLKETDELGRTALHIAVIELLIFKKNAKISEVILQNTLEKNFYLYPCDKLLNWTWIDYYHKYFYANIYDCELLSDTMSEAYWNYQYQIRNESFWKFMSEAQFDTFSDVALEIPSINMIRILFLLKACIERGDDINATDRFGYTPLNYGICSQQSEIVELLLEKHADTELNPTDQDLTVLLGLSLRIYNKNILTMLIKAMGESLRDCSWLCILSNVEYEGSIEAIEMLLEVGVNVNIQDEDGDSLLHLAVQLGRKDLAQLLAQYQVNVNMTNDIGQTALFNALHSHDMELIEMLLNLGADINIADKHGDTVWSIAVKHMYNNDCIQLLLEHGADVNCRNTLGETPLFGAVKINDKQKMEILLNAGANVNIQDEYGNTALHIATEYEGKHNTEMVKMLLDTNANVNIVNESGDTPLHKAVSAGNEDAVRLILQHQAEVFLTNCRQETPLLPSVMKEQITIMNILLNEEVNPNMIEDSAPPVNLALKNATETDGDISLKYRICINTESLSGNTALSCAIKKENVDVVNILLKNGVDVNYVDKYGSHLTPLLTAVETQNLEITEILLRKGADVNFKSEYNVTPLYVAVLLRNINMVKLLLEHGSPLNIVTPFGNLLIKAKERGDISTSLWLLNYWAKRSTIPINDVTFSDEVKHFIQTVEHGGDINLLNKIVLNHEGNNAELVHALLKLASDIKNPTPIGIKCLEAVLELNDKEVDRILLGNFGDKYPESIGLMTAVGYAAIQRSRVMVKILLRNGQGTDNTFLSRVIKYSGQKYPLEILLENQINVNLPGEDGDTPLIDAAGYSTPDVIELLLANGAAINGVGSEGPHRTALIFAVVEGKQENVRLLLQKGAQIHFKQESLLCTAVNAKNVEMVHVLLENGADPNEKNHYGWSALHLAVHGNSKDIVKKLLEFKADVNIANNEGFIPLDYVNGDRHKGDIIRMLRKREAEADNFDDSDDEGDYNERETEPIIREHSETRMADTGQGYKYQLSVAAYLASLLSKNQTVKDYYIFYEVQEVEPFDDIVLAVQFNGSEYFNLYLVQVKSGKVSLDIKKYLDGYNKIKQNKNRKFFGKIGKINEENIQFWYFACKSLPKSQDISFKEDSETKQLELKERQSDATGSIIDKKYNKNYKLCLKGDNITTKHQDFFDNFYVYVGQPSAEKIEVVLRGMWKLNDSTQVIDYLDKYFIKYKQNCLSKTVFEQELLRIRLLNYVVTPIKTIPCQKEPADAWINLTLSHNITIIENATHTKPCLFGCILAKIGDIITAEEWNKCIDNEGKLNDEIKAKFSSLKNKPQTMKDLVIHFWMSNQIPLILKAENELPALKEFAHLNKHYVIIDSKLKKKYDEMESYNLSVIKDLGGLQVDQLLQSISISMQGRKSTSLGEVICGDETLLETLTCSDILKLIEPKKVYLNDECFKDGSDMLFIIESEDTGELNLENYEIIEDNIVMCCPLNQSGICYEKAVKNPKFKNCTIYRLHSQTSEASERKLSLLDECKSIEMELDEALNTGESNSAKGYAGLEYFFIDQHGNNVYREREGKAMPVIGEMINISCPKYLIRRMRKGVIKCGENRSSPDNSLNPVVEYTEMPFWEDEFFIQTTRKICVVTGESGVGKSAFLRSLIHICQPSNYVLFCDLARYQTDLYDKRRKQSELCRDPLNFLCNKHNSLPYSKFLSVLKKDAKRLIIVLDSFDEIVPTCKENVLKLINKLNSVPELGKIVIGSRLLTINLLNNRFNIDLVEIEGLNKEWNGDYIQNWNVDENYLRNIPAEFVKNPLYLNFLRTVAESNINMESLNRWTLYKAILDLNIDLYYKRRNQNCDDTDRKSILKYCYALAFRAFLPYNRITKKLAENIKEVYSNFAKIGVIRCFNKKGLPVFIHRTFLEFLISRWLIETPDKEDAKHVYEYLLGNRMHDALHIHSEQFRLHKAVIGKELTQVQNLCNEDSELLKETDELGRTALHIAAIDLLIFKRNTEITNVILQNTLEKNFNLYPCDKLLNWTWIDYYHKYLCRNTCDCHLLSDTMFEAYWNYQYQIRNESFWKFMNDFQFSMFSSAAFLIPSINIIKTLFMLKYYNNEDLIQIEELCSQPEVIAAALPKSSIPELGTTLMHLGCIYSNLNVVSACIGRGDDINAKDKWGYTPLFYGVCSQKSEIVELFLEVGTNTRSKPIQSNMAKLFFLSRRIKNKKIAAMLIKALVKSFRTYSWSSLLYGVVYEGNIETVEMILKVGLNVNIQDKNGNSLLSLAVLYRRKNVVELLARYHVNVNMTNNAGQTALFEASRMCDVELVEMLLNLGADINIADKNDDTILHIAVKRRYSNDCVRLLLQHGADVNCRNTMGETPLFVTVKINNRQTMEILLNAGANVNIQDINGNTALHIASSEGKYNTEMVEMLLNANANVNIVNESGDTPLHKAVSARNEDAVRLIVQHQADVSVTNCRQETPLYIAVVNEQIAIMKILLNLIEDGAPPVNLVVKNATETDGNISLKYKMYVNVESLSGDTPLFCAIRKKNVEMVEILLENGADGNYVDKYTSHLTPLFNAVETQHLDIIGILLRKGADVNFKNDYDVTPLYLATLLRNVNMVKLLLEHGAHLNVVTPISTLLIKATEKRDISTALWLLNYWANSSTIPINDVTFSNEVKHFIQTVENGNDMNLLNKIVLIRNENKAEFGHELLKFAADVTNPTPIGIYCLKVVLNLNDKKVDRKLLDNFGHKYWGSIQKYTALGYAAIERNRVMVKILLRNRQETDSTALTRIIQYFGQTYPLEILLENHINVNLPNEDGYTPLICALQMGSVEMLEFLIDSGAHLNGDDSLYCSRTPLYHAVRKFTPEIVRVLLQKGADIYAKREGLLCIAASRKSVEIVQMLLENGANPNEKEPNGWSALHYAVNVNSKDIVKKLLEFKADVNITNDEGFIPLDYIKNDKCKSDIIRMLQKREAGLDNFDDSDDEGDYNE
ncbi:molting protein mlt-4 [Holotrichia oblita]|uniref:Molting protein mlt-4 n=1 Tax=Holotrichia oblita TaxID=644536 RepID=A0ACB9SMI7_HOLOL|nr:molting protein mlt-4 [Holotrichia oblita]